MKPNFRTHYIGIMLVFCLLCGCFSFGSEKTEHVSALPELPDNTVHTLEIIDEPPGDPAKALALNHQTADTGVHSLIRNSEKNPKKAYTVMIYMAGSDLESRNSAATQELLEMAAQKVNYKKTNVLVCTGGTKHWHIGIPSDCNTVIDLSGGVTNFVSRTETSSNMGAAGTLADFVNYAAEQYPADRYALIFWDHGGGPLWGCCGDELFQNDSLTLPEMKKAMDQTIFAQKHLDFVGFDACLMGNLETAAVWKDYADYMIASEEMETGSGWDYSFLPMLKKYMCHKRLFRKITDSYRKSYEKNTEYHPDYTLGIYDLSETDALLDSMNALAAEMNASLKEGGYPAIQKALTDVRYLGTGDDYLKSSETYGLIDIRSFLECLQTMFPKQTAAVNKRLKKMITAETASSESYGGMSVFCPTAGMEETYDSACLEETMLPDDYAEMIRNYNAVHQSAQAALWSFQPVQKTAEGYVLELTEEQAASLSYVIVDIYDFPDDSHAAHVFSDLNCRMDGNRIYVPLDPEVMTLQSDSFNETVIPAMRTKSGNKEKKYTTYTTEMTTDNGIHILQALMDKYRQKIAINVRRKENGEGEIESIREVSDIYAADGKNEADLLHRNRLVFNILGSVSVERIPGKDCFRLGDTHGGFTRYLTVGEELRAAFRPVSELDERYAFRLRAVDIYNNVHFTDLYLLTEPEYETIDGIQYVLKNDEYLVSGAEDNVVRAVIPDEINGIPVTGICAGAFIQNTALQEIILPDTITSIDDNAFLFSSVSSVRFGKGLKTIGYNAFYGCEGLTEIDLPDTVERLERQAFGMCGLREVRLPANLQYMSGSAFNYNDIDHAELSENNPYYKVQDGAVYTKDGKELVSWLSTEPQCTVPEGTVKIGYSAFAGSRVQKVKLPESLREIADRAFFECLYIEEINFPNSLERIGDYAFDEPSNAAKFQAVGQIKPIPGMLSIGKNVSEIGSYAFDGLLASGFTVDPENPYYASANGFITDKCGKTLLTAPVGLFLSRSLVNIPDGITTIPAEVFRSYNQLRQFVLPASVYRFGRQSFADSFGNQYAVFHCAENSPAEQYAKLYDIAYDHNTELSDLPESYGYALTLVTERQASSVPYYGSYSRQRVVDDLVLYDGCEKDAAEYAADHAGIDYKQNALNAAQYLADSEYDSYTREEIRLRLIENFDFTEEEAAYAAEHIVLPEVLGDD